MKVTVIERTMVLRLEMVESPMNLLYYRVICNRTGYIEFQHKEYGQAYDWMWKNEFKYSQNSYK